MLSIGKVISAANSYREKGNDFFRQLMFREALECYNMSLCFSLPMWQQCSLAYANRSAVYLELEEFDHCLNNIQLARDSKYPHEEKLKLREQRCNAMKKSHRYDPENDPDEFFKLSYPANEKIPFIANCLELGHDEKYGHHIIATRNLNPGDVIAVEEIFLPSILREGAYKRCSICLKSNMLDLIPCDKCLGAMFCSEECFNKPSARCHFSSFMEPNSKDKFELAFAKSTMRCLSIAETSEKLCDVVKNSDKKTIFDCDFRGLDDHARDLMKLMVASSLNTKIPMDQLSKLDPEGEKLALDALKKLQALNLVEQENDLNDLRTNMRKISVIRKVNAVPLISNLANGGEGKGIFLFSSLFKHSCDPNVLFVLVDTKTAVVVTKPIRKGEQLFNMINPPYYFGRRNRDARRAELLKSFNIWCTCPACENDYSLYSLSRRDPKFIPPTLVPPKTFKDAANRFKKNCEYIKNNFKEYPSLEVAVLLSTNYLLFGETPYRMPCSK